MVYACSICTQGYTFLSMTFDMSAEEKMLVQYGL